MQVELSKHEIEIIEKAMDAWEKEAGMEAAMGGMIGAILRGPQGEKAATMSMDKKMEVAREESRKRRVDSVLLRAKLYQALARDSEMDVGEAKEA